MNFKEFIKNNQQKIVLIIGFALVAGIGFGLGRFSKPVQNPPEIRFEESTDPQSYYNSNSASVQSSQTSQIQVIKPSCDGKIKGTASSKIYHLPGQAGYAKLNSLVCFNTEAEAQAAGFRRSSR